MTEKQITGVSELMKSLTIPLIVIVMGYFSANMVSLNNQVGTLTVRLSVMENTLQLYLSAIQQQHNVNYSTGPSNVK